MKRACWLLALVGCVDEEPSRRPPVAVEIGGDLDIVFYHHREQSPIVVGGTQRFRVHHAGTVPGVLGPVFELPYTVEAADDHLRVEDHAGASFTVRGLAPGEGGLRIYYADGAPLGSGLVSVAEVEQVDVELTSNERWPRDVFSPWPRTRSVVWAPGEHTVRIGLYHDMRRLGDSSMRLELAGAERTGLDTLHVPDATVGSYQILVTAGNQPTRTVDFVVVDQADSASLLDSDPPPTSLVSGRLTSLCFEARSGGRYIVGLPWAFTVAGDLAPQPQLTPNCYVVMPRQTSGDITITAAAAGQSVSLTLPVVTM